MADQSNIQSAASKSIRPFRSSEEYLYAMKEDLAEWLNTLYDLEISEDNFMECLETGCILCQHANNVNRAALDFQLRYPEAAQSMRIPSKDVVFQSRNIVPGSFLARDNVSNFIAWCRQELGIKDVLMFETNDLVQRRNEKNFVLCLLEVARRGAKLGMLAPMLIQLEEEIEEEIRDQENLGESSPPNWGFCRIEEMSEPASGPCNSWQQNRILYDMRNLDELVREILGKCSCPAQFPMTKVSEGKYKVGDSSALIFIRVLRTHVMVRVGGGWDTLEHYLDKHDPCRCAAFAHRYQQSKASGVGCHSKSSSAHSSRSTSPGPQWRGDNGVCVKSTERRSLEAGPTAVASCRAARLHRPSLPTELDGSVGHTSSQLPRPPRDRSEPRHLTSLRNKDMFIPAARRSSGDSDSLMVSSRGAGGAGRGLSGGSRRTGEEVVLLINRKEGRHIIERPAGGRQSPSLQLPPSRARSQSRERPTDTTLKPSPVRQERGRSVGPDVTSRFKTPRSLSQGKVQPRSRAAEVSPGPRILRTDRREDGHGKQSAPGSPKHSGGSVRRQPPHSPAKGTLSSPSKKGTACPRPPAPHSPSTGRSRLQPSASHSPQARRSCYSATRPSHMSCPRSPRVIRKQGCSSLDWSDTEDKGQGSGFRFPALPSLDPQKEHDLIRSFEAEFLANTQMNAERSGGDVENLPVSQEQEQGFGDLLPAPISDANVTDSAYSSSNSSTSSVCVGGKVKLLPDFHETKRGGLDLSSLDTEQQGDCGAHNTRPAAISNCTEHGEINTLYDFVKPLTFCCGDINPDQQQAMEMPMDARQQGRDWVRADRSKGSSCRHLDFPYPKKADKNRGEGLPLPGACLSLPLQQSEDCSLQDSSSENSSVCASLSEARSEESTSPTPPGDGDGGVILRPKRGLRKAERVPSIYKLKLRPRIRPRTDNRPENGPSRIPTPVRYWEQSSARSSPPAVPQVVQSNGYACSPKAWHQTSAGFAEPQSCSPMAAQQDCSSIESSSLDDDTCM